MSQASTTADPDRLNRIQNALRNRDYVLAHDLITDWLEVEPNQPDAHYFLAVTHRAQGRATDAIPLLHTLLQQDPLHSRGLQEMGHCLRDRHKPYEALNYYQRATRLNPSLIASWVGQAQLLEALNQPKAAQLAGKEVVYLRSLPQPLRVVMDLCARNLLGKAEELCKRFMQKNPRHIEGMRLLADIASRLGALDEAHLLLSTAAQLAPANDRVAIDFIQLLRRRQAFAAAMEAAETLLATDPANPRYQSLVAIEAMQIGDYDRALAGFSSVLKNVPGDPVTLTSRGHALKTCGKTDDAIASYRTAIEQQKHYGEAWYSLANLKTYTFSGNDIDTMESLCADSNLEHQSRIYLHFALGKAYEDEASFEASFKHYQAGNEAKRRQSLYNADRITEEFDAQRTICNQELFERFAGGGCSAPDPIFIVGLPRAGSTLLEQILASHSQVDGTLELPNILSLAQQLRRADSSQSYPDVLQSRSAEEYRQFGERFLAETAIHRRGAPFFIDKMPNNFRHIGLIKLILPNAKIIDARRNPMACCFSGYKQLFAEGQEFSYDLTDLGRYYSDYLALMTHWQSVLPNDILLVRNEDIIADLETQVRRLLDFCGLPFETQCLHYWKTERAVKTPSSEQVRRPVSAQGQHQWRHYRPWLTALEDALGPELVAQSTNGMEWPDPL